MVSLDANAYFRTGKHYRVNYGGWGFSFVGTTSTGKLQATTT
jgi:hypothetical protein